MLKAARQILEDQWLCSVVDAKTYESVVNKVIYVDNIQISEAVRLPDSQFCK